MYSQCPVGWWGRESDRVERVGGESRRGGRAGEGRERWWGEGGGERDMVGKHERERESGCRARGLFVLAPLMVSVGIVPTIGYPVPVHNILFLFKQKYVHNSTYYDD